MTQLVWLNGEFLPLEEAAIPVTDRSFLMGDGVFETMRCYNGRIFRLRRHLRRLDLGLAQTRIKIGWALEHLGIAAEELAERNGLPNARVRLTVSRGVPDGHSSLADLREAYAANVLISATPIPDALPGQEKGWKLKTVSLPTTGDCFPSVKFTSYGPHVLARGLAIEAGCDEALILNAKGRASEGAMTNLFWVSGGVLFTPPLSEGCLAGVTRQTVMRIAKNSGIPVVRRRGRMKRLYDADEVFMSASVMEIVPVRSINGNIVGKQFPGPITAKLQEQYREAVESYLAKHSQRVAWSEDMQDASESEDFDRTQISDEEE